MTVSNNAPEYGLAHDSGANGMSSQSIVAYRPSEHESNGAENHNSSNYNPSNGFAGSDPFKQYARVLYKHTLHQMTLVSDAIRDSSQQEPEITPQTASTTIAS